MCFFFYDKTLTKQNLEKHVLEKLLSSAQRLESGLLARDHISFSAFEFTIMNLLRRTLLF